jgi:hypothetical protein
MCGYGTTKFLDWNRLAVRALFYGVAEASLTCWYHGTCLSFDFQGIDRGGESHGGCNWRSIMAERCIGGDEDEQWPWQEGGNTCGLHF